jgi:hypothetical protein
MSNKVTEKNYLYNQYKNFYHDVLTSKLALLPLSSSTVTYDNTTSGLTSTNVQDALDETINMYQTGCNLITNAITYQGETPLSNSPSDLSQAILDMQIAMGSEPLYAFDVDTGYVDNSGAWVWGGDTVSYSDIYPIENGLQYALFIFSPPGTRFRAMYTTVDITDPSTPHTKITGTRIIARNNPLAGDTISFTVAFPDDAPSGYCIVTKDNAGTPNVRTALIEKILKP